ncbi:Dynein heavy chain [Giardia duodenalis]|uniref:Dynein heavy chain n=1 Tax=Giardia intestinalis TaxID=5741 RepID=V6TG00_GIAIN|nr:Dynein heavy chain [Giardia intestinalis]
MAMSASGPDPSMDPQRYAEAQGPNRLGESAIPDRVIRAKSPIQANSIGVFSRPSAGSAVSIATGAPMEQRSPFRDIRASSRGSTLAHDQQITDVADTASKPFTTRKLRTVAPSINSAAPTTVINHQTTAGVISGGTAKSITMTQTVQNVEATSDMTSEILHFMADPVIRVPFKTVPGSLPRSIALERKRRELASVNTLELFQSVTELYEEAARVSGSPAVDPSAADNEMHIPLELFDDTEFDVRTMAAWWTVSKAYSLVDMASGRSRTVKGLYGQAFINGQWERVVVIGQKKPADNEPFDDRLLCVLRSNVAKRIWVPRLYVHFWGEDPRIYVERLRQAIFLRDQTESLLKYDLFINSMPVSGLFEFSDALKFSIQRRSIPFFTKRTVLTLESSIVEKLKDRTVEAVFESLTSDVVRSFYTSQNRVLFDLSLQRQPSLMSELNLEHAVDYIQYEKIYKYNNIEKAMGIYRQLVSPCNQEAFTANLTDDTITDTAVCYNIGKYLKKRFTQARDVISFNSFLTSPEAIKALQCLNYEVDKILSYSIIDFTVQANSLFGNYEDFPSLRYDDVKYNQNLYAIISETGSATLPLAVKTYTLDDFRVTQNTHARHLKQYLEETWTGNLKHGIIDALQKCGKGWYDISVKSKDVYESSKLKRIFRRITITMADTIRYLCEFSCKQYVAMFRAGAMWKVKSFSTSDVRSYHRDNALLGRSHISHRGADAALLDEQEKDHEVDSLSPLALPLSAAGSSAKALETQKSIYLTCYRQPLFSIAVSVLDGITSNEDKVILTKLNSEYIYGVTALADEEVVDFDDDGKDDGNADVIPDDDGDDNEKDDTAQKTGDASKQSAEKASDRPTTEKGSRKSRRATTRPGSSVKAGVQDVTPEVPLPDTVKTIAYMTKPEDFISVVLQVFETGLATVSGVGEIEPLVIQNIIWADRTHIASPSVQEELYVNYRTELVEYMETAIQPLTEYLRCFSRYTELILLDEEKWASTVKFRAELYLKMGADAKKDEGTTSDTSEIEGFSSLPMTMQTAIQNATPLSPADLRSLVNDQLARQKDILLSIPESVHVGLFVVRNGNVRNFLSNKCLRLAELTQEIISEIAGKKSNMISQTYFAINKKINRKNKNIEEVSVTEEFIKGKIDGIISSMKANIGIMLDYYSILDDLFVGQTNQVVQQRYKTMSYPLEIRNLVTKTMEVLSLDREKFKDEQNQQQQSLEKSLENCTRQVTSFPLKYTSVTDYVAAAEDAEQIFRQLNRLQEKAKLFNKREIIMDLPMTDYTRLEQVIRDFEPLNTLWKTILDYNTTYTEVMENDFKVIDASVTERNVDQAYRNIAKCIRSLKDNAGNTKEIAETVKTQIADFKLYMPLLVALRNPGMRKRHWYRISREINIDLSCLRYINGIEVKDATLQRGSSNEAAEANGEAVNDDVDSETDYAEYTAEQLAELNSRPVEYTFRQAIEVHGLNEPSKLHIIQKVSEVASKEFAIEQVLKNIQAEWADVEFDLLEYANTNTYVLRSLDDIIQKLDDNITLVQTMGFSPFKKYFEEQIASWERKLSLVSEIIEVWLQVQQQWLYLEPVFSSPDISRQLPAESKNFRSVDAVWRKLMGNTYKTPNVLEICLNTDKLLPKLRESNKILDTVQKGLSDYLEAKRQAFPRFYFLSDAELLSILSQTRDPNCVQPYFRSCFENINRVKFAPEEQDYQMSGMFSHEGEWVEFSEPLYPKGSVEVWMGNLEKMMIRTVRQRIFESILAYQVAWVSDGIKGRSQWVRRFFAQGVLAASQLFFCSDTETAIVEGRIEEFYARQEEQLSSLTDLVRQGLTKLEAKTLAALLTLDVHNRDTVANLVKAKITRTSDFEWMSQLRYYVCNVPDQSKPEDLLDIAIQNIDPGSLETNEDTGVIQVQSAARTYFTKTNNQIDMHIRQVQTTYPYGFEYLGNTSRLVITPLTDRIYITLTSALSNYLGGAPAGPAGTGKTESTKDLAKALAQPVIVFNCSEGLDYKAMGKFFTGLAMSGAWSCFDEFNRIDIEVLSVIAQQILTIQRAIINRQERFLFEGREISLKPTCAVFITMNPGYAGRVELPDNLKALFRSVSCMVPDYSLIAEIRLYSFGYKNAKILARKTTASFKLSSEQLSSQDHYDFGMRALNTTLQAAGNMIREYTSNGKLTVTEEQILLRAIKEVNVPKFLSNDVILFGNIVKDMFPGTESPHVDFTKLIESITYVLRSNQMGYMQIEESFINKVIEVYQTVLLRHGLMTVGQTSSGKTVALEALALALNKLNQEEYDARLAHFNKLLRSNPGMTLAEADKEIPEDYTFMKAVIHRINPKSITMGQLYGEFDLVSHEWSDGILADLIRKSVAAYNAHTTYIEQSMYLQNDGVTDKNVLTISQVNGPAFVRKFDHVRQWLHICGPIDALWIESMNTVLDDNKKLCLTSGEIIALTNVISLVFEVEDLAEASPATVSRAGMIFFNGLDTVSSSAYVDTWIDRLPDDLRVVGTNAARGKSASADSSRGTSMKSRLGVTERYSDVAKRFKELFVSHLNDSLDFVAKNTQSMIKSCPQNLIHATTKILDCFIREFKPNEFNVIEEQKIDTLNTYLEVFFFFALAWGVGSNIATEDDRKRFDSWLRARINEGGYLADFPLPEKDPQTGHPTTIYDYCFVYPPIDAKVTMDDNEEGENQPRWVPWMQTIPEFSIDSLGTGPNKTVEFQDIFIPTADTVRSSYLVRKLLLNGFPVLAVGQTGTGKTSVIKNYLLRGPASDMTTNIPIFLNFSARTGANQTQDFIDGKMEKRRKGVYGPVAGKKFVLFIDDLNLPNKEKYGAIPVIELIRQMVDHGGWYDRDELFFKQIIDTYLITAMGPPGGGRQTITNRMQRHLNFLVFPEMNDNGLKGIFSTIVKWWSGRSFTTASAADLADEVKKRCQILVDASLSVYNSARAELLPTPEKSHYVFNLRDLSKVFQGILMIDPLSVVAKLSNDGSTVPYSIADVEKNLIRLWIHENMRVYYDRLIDDHDRHWFEKLLTKQTSKFFNRDLDKDVLEGKHPDTLLFGNFANPQQTIRPYKEITDIPALSHVLSDTLNDYNDQNSKQMNLVMFRDAISHLSRISRILRQPGGNCLLIGLGGSGRSSLARLSAFLAEYDLHTIELRKNYGIPEWRDDLKKILMTAGVDNKQIVFLFTDSMIVNEAMVEDINAILNTADIQNLYDLNDMETIFAAVRPLCMEKGLQPTKIALFDAYLTRVKANIHLVLTFSPSAALRTRLRNFPSLVNCCTLDWFTGWPDEALIDVGRSVYNYALIEQGVTCFPDSPQSEFLNAYLDEQSGMELDETKRKEKKTLLQNSIIKLCMRFHISIETWSKRYKEESGRLNHITPTLYLTLLSTFARVLQAQYNKVNEYKMQLKSGLHKLLDTQTMVAKMQEDLIALQPVLERTQTEVEAMMVDLDKDKTEADKTRQVVAKEKQIAAAKRDECEAIKNDAERDLAEAIPALEAALEALKSLKVSDLSEIGHYTSPPYGVKLVLEAVCQFFGVKGNRVQDKDKPGQFIEDYWDPSKKLLSDPRGLLDKLMNYDRDNIKPDIIKKIQKYIVDPEFVPKEIEKKSKAAMAMCSWVHAMNKYYHVAKQVEPKRQKLAEAEGELTIVQQNLDKLVDELNTVENKIAQLEAQFSAAVEKKEDLTRQVEETGLKLERAEKLISGLGGEKDRWTQAMADMDKKLSSILGDCLFSAGCIVYLGAFTSQFRTKIAQSWIKFIDELNIPRSTGEHLNLKEILSDEVEIQHFHVNGLPSDNHSIENALFMYNSDKYPLLIDPQGQGMKFVRNMEKDNSLTVCKASDKDLLRTMENALRFGKPVMIVNLLEEIDPALDGILQKQVYKDGNTVVIKLGDQIIPYNPNFRVYLVTSLPNPKYSPENAVKVLTLNFAINESGLEEQLLATVVNRERQDLESMKSQLVISNSRMRQELKSLEATILRLLSESTGDILSDETLIETLSQSQKTSQEIATKVAESEKTEKEIDVTRELYRPVATRASILYFCCCDMANIDSMYQYSLQWYVSLFVQAIADAEQADELSVRLENLIDHFTYYLYTTICRSLFEVHKLLFAVLVAIRIKHHAEDLNTNELRYLLIGSASATAPKPNPCPEWLSERSWINICDLDNVSGTFKGFSSTFANKENQAIWRRMFESSQPETLPIPQPYQDALTPFQRFLPLMCIRPDKIIAYSRIYIEQELGPRFNEPQLFNLELSFKDSNNVTPLLFILSSGSDPMADLFRFADEMRMSRKMQSISLGQGQGAIASQLITQGIERGSWIILMNCHLAVSWMPELDKIIEQLSSDPSNIHRDFRLWLTSMPSEQFPVSILQNSVKMTNEAALGMRNNVLRTYSNLNDKILNETIQSGDPTKIQIFKKLTFSMSVFHAVTQERRKFGPLGYNISYDFTSGDLDMCFKQLGLFIDSYTSVPYNVLQFLFGKINYCGRVTDYNDERCLTTILNDYLSDEALVEGYDFSRMNDTEIVSIKQLPDNLNYKDYLECIREQIPNDPRPEIFGLHMNAAITCDNQAVQAMLNDLIKLQPKDNKDTKGGDAEDSSQNSTGNDKNVLLLDQAQGLLDRCPDLFDVEAVSLKYPTRYEESFNTVLVQECMRYNKLLINIKKSLQDLQKAIRGFSVMNAELEELADNLSNNKTPALWLKYSYPCLKPLASYYIDLLDRISFINVWIEKGIPICFWISGFFFTQGFLTGCLQNFARKYVIAIDKLIFRFTISNVMVNTTNFLNEGPELNTRVEALHRSNTDGCYVYGLYMEGARWCMETSTIQESYSRELYSRMPVIHFLPDEQGKDVDPEVARRIYRCPAYRTLARAGVLSTTGHSTNFIMPVDLPIQADESAKWTKRGVALFAALNQ